MRDLSVIFIAVFTLAVVLAVPAAAEIQLEAEMATHFQDVENDLSQEMGFNEALFNLKVSGSVNPDVDGYVELLTSTAGDQEIDVYQAYMSHDELFTIGIFPVNARIGRFQLNYGQQRGRSSNNADVQSNSLVGNSLVDLVGSQTGLEFYGQYLDYGWSVAVTNGLEGSDFSDERDLALNIQFTGEFLPGLTGALSYHTVSHSEPDIPDDILESNFGFNRFAREVYSVAGAHTAPDLSGHEVDALQLDLSYDFLPLTGLPIGLYLNYGTLDVNAPGVPLASGIYEEFEVDYMTFEARYDFTPRSWFALRYTDMTIDPDEATQSSGDVDRLQVGFGHELGQNVIAKLEYVTQDVDDDVFAFYDLIRGEDLTEFDGVVGEVSIRF